MDLPKGTAAVEARYHIICSSIQQLAQVSYTERRKTQMMSSLFNENNLAKCTKAHLLHLAKLFS